VFHAVASVTESGSFQGHRTSDVEETEVRIEFSTLKALKSISIFHALALRRASRTAIKVAVTTIILLFLFAGESLSLSF
jgi:hypothetical protein